MSRFALAAVLAISPIAAVPAAAQAVANAACTQLERSVGLNGAECGVLTLQQVAEIGTRIENAR